MEYEHGEDGLTFRFTYARTRPISVVITGISGGAGAILQSHQYPHIGGSTDIIKLFYHTDRIGTVDFLTSNVINPGQQAGQGQNSRVQAFNHYDTWGLPLGASATDPRGNSGSQNTNNQATIRLGARQLHLATSFQGFMYDAVLNIYFAQARMYDPNTRRFMAVDPVRGNIHNPQLMVAYTFVLNNPLRWIDPLGLSPVPSGSLRDIVTEAGGNVSWNNDTRMADITIGGRTVSISRDEVDVVDNSMQMNAEVYARIFQTANDNQPSNNNRPSKDAHAANNSSIDDFGGFEQGFSIGFSSNTGSGSGGGEASLPVINIGDILESLKASGMEIQDDILVFALIQHQATAGSQNVLVGMDGAASDLLQRIALTNYYFQGDIALASTAISLPLDAGAIAGTGAAAGVGIKAGLAASAPIAVPVAIAGIAILGLAYLDYLLSPPGGMVRQESDTHLNTGLARIDYWLETLSPNNQWDYFSVLAFNNELWVDPMGISHRDAMEILRFNDPILGVIAVSQMDITFPASSNSSSQASAAMEFASSVIGGNPARPRSLEEKLEDIAKNHGLEDCVAAAIAMANALDGQNFDEPFFAELQFGVRDIDALTNQPIDSITVRSASGGIYAPGTIVSTSGYHVGMMLNGIVRCNIHPSGLPMEVWFNDFVGEGFQLAQTRPASMGLEGPAMIFRHPDASWIYIN